MTDGIKKPNKLFSVENLKEGIRKPHRIPPYLFRLARRTLKEKYLRITSRDYNEMYLRKTKSDVLQNPEGAVGPPEKFEEMREWQFSFLTQEGLGPDDRLLDLGCGVLRGGIPLIEYLEEGHYYGMDISTDALTVARERIRERNLSSKEPILINNDDLRFREAELDEVNFDYVWAQSVITHLPPELLRELIENIDRVLKSDGTMYATYHHTDGESPEKITETDYAYPVDYIRSLAGENNLSVEVKNVRHPNDLSMVCIS